VAEYAARIPIAELWYDGDTGSADMMAHDASRHLGAGRRTFAAGI
jgi:hypothetical protein